MGPAVKTKLATVECDEQPDSTHKTGIIKWVKYPKLADLPLFPLISLAVTALSPSD